MSERTILHHCFPKFLAEFADQCVAVVPKRRLNRIRVAKDHFASLGMDVNGRITSAQIPFSEVPATKLPAIYFTRTGQHPVVIQESSSAGYSIRLWDGRESICHRSRLEKTLEPVGYFLSTENTSGSKSALSTLLSALVDEKKFVALGVGNGAVNCSLLILFVFALFHIFQTAFPVAEMSSVGLAFTGLTAAVLSTFGFLQARFLVNAWFENLSDTNRSREIEMPPPFPIQALTSASSGRIMTEAASAPFFLAAGAIFVGYDVTSVAAWGALTGCAIPAFLFLSNLPDLLKLWKQALWLFEEKLSIFEEDTDDEVEEETPGTEWKITLDDSMVRAHNLFLAHPEEDRSPLVDHISLKVAKGEKVGFIGKSNGEVPVFLRLISGMLEADRGIVWLDNKMVAGDQSHTIGWFSERNSLIDGTLRENICLNRAGELSRKQIEKALELTGVDQFQRFATEGLDMMISESGAGLTGDEKMRILLTRSLIHRPEVLIFDSPKGTRHFAGFQTILSRYLAVNECTLLLGVKDSSQLDLTSRTIIIEAGKVAMDAPTAEVADLIQVPTVTKP